MQFCIMISHRYISKRITGLSCLLILLLFQYAGYSVYGRENSSSPGSGFAFQDSLKLNYYTLMANRYLKKGNIKLDLVRQYLDSAMNISKDFADERTADLHFIAARYSYETGDFSKAEEELLEAERKSQVRADYNLLVRILQFKGRYLLRTGFFQESRNSYEKSIVVAKTMKIKEVIPGSFEGIANVMNTARDIPGYRHFLHEMIRAAKEESDTSGIESGLLQLGNSFVEGNRDMLKADSALKACLALSLIRKDPYFSGFSSANIGWNFYLERNYDSSRFYYEKSLKYSVPAKLDGITANSLGNLGTIYRDLGQAEKAKTYYAKSLLYARQLNDWYTLSWVYNDLHKYYLGAGDTSKAYNNFVLYKIYNDSVQLKRSSQGLNDARIRYEADNHKKEIDLLSERLKNNRILNISISILSLLIVFIALLVIVVSRMNARRRLSEMNRKVAEITQANLRQQMNPHFIFNTLNSIQYFMYQNDKLATNNYLTKFSNLIRKVLENSQHTSVPLNDEIDALTFYLELENMRFRDKFDFSIKVSEDVDPILYQIPTMLIQPYVENSICHGIMPLGHKGHVEIEISLHGDHLLCRIEDNGIGREEGMKNKIAKNTSHNSLGTQITASRLDLVNSIHGTDLKTVYTDLKDASGNASGTRVEIQIPIMT
jgi:tetratricopeptide (TPR) repeat protein